ncbi:MAG TPA: NHL repeat-containing protein [Candidatus Eisenbacteria bacterium]
MSVGLIAAAIMTAPPAAGWDQPGYSLEWQADTGYGLATDGQQQIIALGQPPYAYGPEGQLLGRFGENLVAVPPLWAVVAMSPAGNTHLFARNIWTYGQAMVVELDRHGRLVRQVPLPPQLAVANGNYDFRGIAVDAQGRLYLSAYEAGEIHVFGTDGTQVATWGSAGSGSGQLMNPSRLMFDADGTLFVADRGNGRIQRLTPDGNFLPPLEASGASFKDFGFDRAGNIYCLSAYGGVRVYDRQFNELGRWNDRGPGKTLDGARLLVVDGNDNVYVAVEYGVIVKFDSRLVIPPAGSTYSPKLVLSALPAAGMSHPCRTAGEQSLESAQTTGELADRDPRPYYFVCLLVARGNGSYLAGVQCGLSYHDHPSDQDPGRGLEIFDWHLCADLEFPTPAGTPSGAPAWPGAGSGNLITWDPIFNCQKLDFAVAGYFYVGAYSATTFSLTPRPVDMAAKVAYCATSGEFPLVQADLGFVNFSPGGTAAGCNPVLSACTETTPVKPTTWSRIKAISTRQ